MQKPTLDLFDLTGKRALVTGSSRGIGFALAKGLAGAGAEILLNGRNTQALGNAAKTLAEQGATVKALAFDVTSPDSISEAITHIEAEIGPIDILINNAGMQYRASLEDVPHDKFEQLMVTNINSIFYVSQAVAKSMMARKTGKIINICSVTSALARAGITPYVTSKGAVANMTKGMAADWAKHGLNVNGIAPGFFKTDLNEALATDPKFSEWLENRTPMGRWGELKELVGAATYLASDAASFVNGHILYVDGGIVATT